MVKRQSKSLFDVAAKAGVSHQTVSRVLNNHKNVSAKTRESVEKALKELNYRPNSAARALVTGVTSTIGVLCFDTTFYGPASMLHGVQVAALENSYDVKFYGVQESIFENLIDGIKNLTSNGIDGLIIMVPQLDEKLLKSKFLAGIPLVIVGGSGSVNASSVAIDQYLGARLATKHLIELGHKNISHLYGPLNWSDAKQRNEGWLAEMKNNNLSVTSIAAGDWTAKSGYLAGLKLLTHQKVTAVFAANDAMALGLYQAAEELGLKVPADISIVGFDNSPESEYFRPALTTVNQDFSATGQQGLELLIQRINGESLARQHRMISPELLVRGSTAPRSAKKRG